jgi:hypothetical protein
MNASLPSLGNFASRPGSHEDRAGELARARRPWLRRLWLGNLVALAGYLLTPALFVLVNDGQTDELFLFTPLALEASHELLEAIQESRGGLIYLSLAGVAVTSLYGLFVGPESGGALLLAGPTYLIAGAGWLAGIATLGSLAVSFGIMILSWVTLLATVGVVLLLLAFGAVAISLVRWLLGGFLI